MAAPGSRNREDTYVHETAEARTILYGILLFFICLKLLNLVVLCHFLVAQAQGICFLIPITNTETCFCCSQITLHLIFTFSASEDTHFIEQLKVFICSYFESQELKPLSYCRAMEGRDVLGYGRARCVGLWEGEMCCGFEE